MTVTTTGSHLSGSTPVRPTRTGATGALRTALHYTVHTLGVTVRNVSFVIFSVGMPVVLYLVFSQAFGRQGDPSTSAVIMVSMAAYGSLGAAMGGGAQLAVERRSGWFRQLMITTLPPRWFLWARAAVIMILTLPALILVFGAGALVGGVRLSALTWLTALVAMWVALVPLAVLGIVIGVWVKAEAVQGVTTFCLLLLALLGGLWIPTDLMPGALQGISRVLPSYWLGEFGRWPVLPGATFPTQGVVVLAAWCAGLTVLGALGYRRAAAHSKR